MATKKQSKTSLTKENPWLGKKIPTVKVTLEDSSKTTLKALLPEGQWNVLYFYPRDNTPGCTQEAKDFQKLLKKFEQKNINVVGVSPDSPESHQKFIKKFSLKFHLIADEDKILCEKLGTWQLKKFMGREFMGVVRSTFLCNGHKIVHVWQPVKVADHAEDVLRKVKELS